MVPWGNKLAIFHFSSPKNNWPESLGHRIRGRRVKNIFPLSQFSRQFSLIFFRFRQDVRNTLFVRLRIIARAFHSSNDKRWWQMAMAISRSSIWATFFCGYAQRYKCPFKRWNIPYEKLTELVLKVLVRANKNYYLYCIPRLPVAARNQTKGNLPLAFQFACGPHPPRAANKLEGKWKVRTTKNHQNRPICQPYGQGKDDRFYQPVFPVSVD